MKWQNHYATKVANAQTLSEALMAVHLCGEPDGQTTMADFDRFEGLDDLMMLSLADAGREALGSKFDCVSYYGKDTPVALITGRKGVELHLNFYLKYRCIFDTIRDDSGEFMKVFNTFYSSYYKRINRLYPTATIGLTHTYSRDKAMSLQITVAVEPQMSVATAA